MSLDYPFENPEGLVDLDGFLEAYDCSLSSEFYADEFPLYGKEIDLYGGVDVDFRIIQRLVNQNDQDQPALQSIYERLMVTWLEGYRYVLDCPELIIRTMVLFKKVGVVPNLSLLTEEDMGCEPGDCKAVIDFLLQLHTGVFFSDDSKY